MLKGIGLNVCYLLTISSFVGDRNGTTLLADCLHRRWFAALREIWRQLIKSIWIPCWTRPQRYGRTAF